MATIKRYLSPKVVQGKAEVFFRVSVARGKVWRVGSGVSVDPSRVHEDGSLHYPRANQKVVTELRAVERKLSEIERQLLDFLLAAHPAQVVREDVVGIVYAYHHPERTAARDGQDGFKTVFEAFLAHNEASPHRRARYRCLARCLQRYAAYRNVTDAPGYVLDVKSFTADDIMRFEQFFRSEHLLVGAYPSIYAQAEGRCPVARGDNTVADTLKLLRAFLNWAYAQGFTSNKPFANYKVVAERYGTPYYLTISERDRIADFDLSAYPALAVQRDVFVFQCLVGCRVSDLRSLRSTNVVRDAVEYVAKKTRRDCGDVIRVPLGKRGRAIVERYAGQTDGRLLPFISDQKYNKAIKEICRRCGIDRVVTIINPLTGEDERHPICEVASSHIARRTFVGNLYKRVKDPNLVGALSGHKEGSRAFTRYREIDEEMKRELIDMID